MFKVKIILMATLLMFCHLLWAVPTDYLVLSWTEKDGLTSEYHQIVDLPAHHAVKKAPDHHQKIKMIGFNDELIGEISLRNSIYTRAEYHGHDHIDGRIYENERVTFVIRSQVGLVKHLEFPTKLNKQGNTVDFNNLILSAKTQGPQWIEKNTKGITDNRVNLLFMGDGYTNGQSSQFNAHVDQAINYFKGFEPYKSYQNFFSFERLFTTSNQSGADKPAPCFASPVMRDTAFDAQYCIQNTERLLTVNDIKVLIAAAASPNFDTIVMVVNDTVYGGSGSVVATFSANSLSHEIFVHEFGHTFTGLADEYTDPYPGYPDCDDVFAFNCEPNVTNHTIRSRIKWRNIDPSTPIPTPDTFQYNGVVGLFEGARYLENNMYRSERFCNMRELDDEFCGVCQQAFINRIYFGEYADGGAGKISLIEPNSPYPGSNVIPGLVSVTQGFTVDILAPLHGLEVTWSVDDVVQQSNVTTQTYQLFNFTPQSDDIYKIKVEVKDPKYYTVFERTWFMNANPYVIFKNSFD